MNKNGSIFLLTGLIWLGILDNKLIYAQSEVAEDPFTEEATIYLNHLDSFVLSTYYNDLLLWNNRDRIGEETVEMPENREKIYYDGLAALNGATPFNLTYNNYVRAFIDLYVYKKRGLTENCLGISEYYFPIMEEVLDKHNLPMEFKYLAVVESALNIKARSRAGAAGLWQFMYRTGKSYGLEVNSYVDQRYELYASTEAACKFFKDLYRVYGNWELVIAAYNCGPGNVNKAIRRSGGKTDYWDIRPWLPRETRGYVPAFIAVNYAMNYSKEHGLVPRYPDSLNYYTDTLRLSHPFSFFAFSQYFCTDFDHLMYLNPSFKQDELPSDSRSYTVRLPIELTNAYLERRCDFEDYCAPMEYEGYFEEKNNVSPTPKPTVEKHPGDRYVHVVKSGEVLSVIAEQYNCGLSQVKDWNNLSSSRIYAGQKLVIYTDKKIESQPKAVPPKPVEFIANPAFRYHTIKPGDTLWDIAKLYDGLTVSELKNLNKDVDFKRLKPGSKLIVSTNS